MNNRMYTKIIQLLAESSTCDRARVGALLLKHNRIVATGYNGSLPGESHCDDEGHLIVEGHCIRTIHAEANIICFCAKHGIKTNNCVLYVTHLPCQNCTKLLLQAGIKKIYYLNEYRIQDNPFMKNINIEKIEVKK